ncbi:MAG: hypothetical protein LW698_13375, partial [Planctomycetaceae bacterium]|nr:hypothetical protein [Planctomycetaceae bacterium]
MIITAFYRRVGRSESPKNAGVLGSNLDWRTKSTETRPDGTERIVYSNARGQAIWRVSPEAIALPANLADIEQYPDLLNEVAGNFQYISDTSGLIEVTTYATATTATATLA